MTFADMTLLVLLAWIMWLTGCMGHLDDKISRLEELLKQKADKVDLSSADYGEDE